MRPLLAIVGRPNVGKSTLFNRFVGKRLAIVHDAPGVTRDRHYADAHLSGRDLLIVDTGGFDPESDDPMRQGIVRHVGVAIEEADVVLCVLDATSPPLPADREAITLLRQAGKPVIVAANKADNQALEAMSSELYRLGIEQLHPISALHGRGMAELEAAIVRALPPPMPEPDRDDTSTPRVALVGRPNAGKSSLFNRLAGSERSLVDDRPGTTRDPVDCPLELNGERFVLVDTAGIRRKSRVDGGVETASVLRAFRSIERAEVVILLADASEGITEQEARLLGLCMDRGRAIVVGLNKMDLIERSRTKTVLHDARHAIRFAPFAPIVELSVKTGRGVDRLIRHVGDAAREFHKRVGTGELNRFFDQVLSIRPPPTRGGRAPRIYYVTQVDTAPPVFVAMSNAPGNLDNAYKRFVINQLRKAFGFESVPVKVIYRKRGDER